MPVVILFYFIQQAVELWNQATVSFSPDSYLITLMQSKFMDKYLCCFEVLIKAKQFEE